VKSEINNEGMALSPAQLTDCRRFFLFSSILFPFVFFFIGM